MLRLAKGPCACISYLSFRWRFTVCAYDVAKSVSVCRNSMTAPAGTAHICWKNERHLLAINPAPMAYHIYGIQRGQPAVFVKASSPDWFHVTNVLNLYPGLALQNGVPSSTEPATCNINGTKLSNPGSSCCWTILVFLLGSHKYVAKLLFRSGYIN